jgi:hypothetical protein
MPHLNTLLTHAAHELVAGHLESNRHRYIFDPETLVPDIEDTGVPCDPSIYPIVGYYLSEAAGPDHGILTLRDVLKDVLIKVAQEHTTKPQQAVATFCADLERRPFQFLAGGDDYNLVRREANLRRKLKNLGHRLTKSRTRDPLGSNYRVYDIIDRTAYEISVDAPRHLAGLERWVTNAQQDELVG